jgi:hypothetical protein
MPVPAQVAPAQASPKKPIQAALPTVINTPSRIEADISKSREKLMEVALRSIRQEATDALATIRQRDEARRRKIMNKPGCSPCDPPLSTQLTSRPLSASRH